MTLFSTPATLRTPTLTRHAMVMLMASSKLDEAPIEVRDAGSKGSGVFATEPIAVGDWIGPYIGTLTTKEETRARYNDTYRGAYIFGLDDELSIDAQNSTHFSRFFNHAEHGNLEVEVDAARQSIDFFAARDIGVGEELTFDYGTQYWLLWRAPPTPESDSRNYTRLRLAARERDVELTLRYPPKVGTVLPLSPITVAELQAALALPERESRAALLRCLEYFGAQRCADSDLLSLPRLATDDSADAAVEPTDHAALQR